MSKKIHWIEKMKKIDFRFKKLEIGKMAFLFLLLIQPAFGAENGKSKPADEDTLLMFVGENLDALTIASRREEGAWKAPAVALVITRSELRERGADTLSRALETIPGFYMAQRERGTQPYLRGIPDSVLFLYDTLSVSSDTTKSVHPLDYELSLAPVKRVEIVRGAGSVLWGPDAFAGIVNLVPMTGKDLDGVEAGVSYGDPGDQQFFYSNLGYNSGLWDAFLSVSGRWGEEDDTSCNTIRFWGDGNGAVPPDQRYGNEEPGKSRYFEMSGNFSFNDWLKVSGRVSDNRKPYAMNYESNDLTWRESRDEPLHLIRAEVKKELGRASAIRLTGAFSSLNSEYEVIDRTFKQREETLFGEMIFDHSVQAGTGLFMGGFSYRKKRIKDAPVWGDYFPEWLIPENPAFLPEVKEEGYDAGLASLFGQYNHMIGNFNLWIGLRGDEHDKYKDHVSYNAGVGWSPSPKWMLKALSGTAYRTPFARQLQEDEDPDLEKITNLSFQAAWKPGERFETSVCLFYNWIEHHIMEDPYAGLSQPNSQDVRGIEIEGRISPHKTLDFNANLTFLDNSGPDEVYKYNDYSTIGDQGEWIKHFIELEYSYDAGPDTLFNLTCAWRPNDRLSVFAGAGYFSSRKLIYLRDEQFHVREIDSGVWLFNAGAVVRDVIFPDLDLELSIENLTDKDYETPGTYSTIDGDPFALRIMFRKIW